MERPRNPFRRRRPISNVEDTASLIGLTLAQVIEDPQERAQALRTIIEREPTTARAKMYMTEEALKELPADELPGWMQKVHRLKVWRRRLY